MDEPDDLQLIGDDGDDETEFATIATAATIDVAKRKALDQLRKVVPFASDNDIEYVVVEEGSKGGLFGRGKSEARVEARLVQSTASAVGDLPEAATTLRQFVQTVVDLMGVQARVSASETEEWLKADISGDDLGLLIGRHGSTIDALQYLASIVVNGDSRDRRQVVVDAEGYRERRAAALAALADRTAQKVARESESIALKPMSAAERKVIHLHLKDHPLVETASEGNEPFRAVVVTPKRTDG